MKFFLKLISYLKFFFTDKLILILEPDIYLLQNGPSQPGNKIQLLILEIKMFGLKDNLLKLKSTNLVLIRNSKKKFNQVH